MIPIFTLLKWLFSKAALIGLIVVVVVGSYFLKNFADSWIEQQEVRTLEAQQVYEEAKDKAGPQYTALKNQLSAKKREILWQGRQAAEAAKALKKVEGKWKSVRAFWIPGGYDRDDWEADKKRHQQARDRAEAAKARAQEQWSAIQRQTVALRATLLDDNELLAAERSAEREEAILNDKKELIANVEREATEAWTETKDLILITVLVVLFGPFVWKVFSFWIIGGLAMKCRYLYLSKDAEPPKLAEIGESHSALKIPLKEAETLVVKERFLQASKDDVTKKTEYVWNWKYPFLSLVAGLVFLTRIRPSGQKGEITLSCDDDPAIEVVRVDLAEDEELVIRPGFLVGYLYTSEPLKIRSKWNFGLQSWMTLKFRNFLVKGSGAIFLSAGRGFSDERISRNLIVDRDIPVLWNPNLGFKARRAETFWSYALGKNSLFDDEFKGQGRVLCQQVRGFGGGRNTESIWGRFFAIIGKVFGL